MKFLYVPTFLFEFILSCKTTSLIENFKIRIFQMTSDGKTP